MKMEQVIYDVDMPKTPPRVDKEWMNSLVGRQWEIFWQPPAAHHSPESGDDYDVSDDELIADWYAGKVTRATIAGSRITYWVKFVGEEDKELPMHLTPSLVRPCARAWIRRSRALLPRPKNYHRRCSSSDMSAGSAQANPYIIDDIGDSMPLSKLIQKSKHDVTSVPWDSVEDWLSQLPPDTSTNEDLQELQQLKDRLLLQEFPALDHDTHENSIGSIQDFNHIRQLMVFIQSQIWLRSKLACSPEDDTDSDDDDDEDPEPSEIYLDYLVHRLHQLREACVWYYQMFHLTREIFSSTSPVTRDGLLDRDSLFHDSLVVGQFALEACCSHDLSPRAAVSTMKALFKPQPKSPARSVQPSVAATPPTSPFKQALFTTTITGTPIGYSPLSARGATSSASSPHSYRTRRKRRKHTCQRDLGAASPSRTQSNRKTENETVMSTLPTSSPATLRTSLSASWNDAGTVAEPAWLTLVNATMAAAAQWYTVAMASMFRSFTEQVMTPVIEWQTRAERYLQIHQAATLVPNVLEFDSSESNRPVFGKQSSEVEQKQSASAKSSFGEHRLITVADISDCLRCTEDHWVLKRIKFDDLLAALQLKLTAVLEFEEEARQYVNRRLDNSVSIRTKSDRQQDSVLLHLMSCASRCNDESIRELSNMKEFGASETPVTRSMIRDAVIHRQWILDLFYVENTRERWNFVSGLVSRFAQLPRLVTSAGVVDELAQFRGQVARIESRLTSDVSDYIASLNNRDSSSLMSVDEVRNALFRLGQVTSVVTVAEEMLTVRLDILNWKAQANELLQGTRPSYETLAQLRARRDSFLAGSGDARQVYQLNLVPDQAADKEVCAFATDDDEAICDEQVKKLSGHMKGADKWNVKALDVLNVLRGFGHPLAGTVSTGSRPERMVDQNRIAVLLGGYDTLAVDLDDVRDRLLRIHRDALHWSTVVSSFLSDASKSPDEYLSFVEGSFCQLRPIGMLVDPTRQCIESIRLLLRWYGLLRETMSTWENNGSLGQVLVHGFDVLVKFSCSPSSSPFVVSESHFDLFSDKSWKKMKPESNRLYAAVLSRLVDPAIDEQAGHPLLQAINIIWMMVVEDFISRSNGKISHRAPFTLCAARLLFSQNPIAQSSAVAPPPCSSLAKLKALIDAATELENSAKELLSETKGLLREYSLHIATMPHLLARVKAMSTTIKDWNCGQTSLALSPDLEQNLDRNVKFLNWLVCTQSFCSLFASATHFACIKEPDTRTSFVAPGKICLRWRKQPGNGESHIVGQPSIALRKDPSIHG
jgi:hypothetical protein